MLERPQVERSTLIVLPGAEPDNGLLLPVSRGRVMARTRIRWTDAEWPEVLSRVCYEVRIEELRAESVFAPAQLTPSLIVSSWLERRRSNEGRVFDLDLLDARAIVESLQAAAPCGSAEAA